MYALEDCYTKSKHHRIRDESVCILEVLSRIPVPNNHEVDASIILGQFAAHVGIIAGICSS